ncbi:MFS general substrate transporter [Durotheca rogersii]|uniref:MFS general substrate transporter n=1 Tax=Durotheca rogersii TaxID=419775 RepID=UPI00221E68CC|nr:MFS general substrate transporter [Durotheca rogersii]KAI5857466.1 MFS general substrate transporter [Durotheca rogersii]
MRTDTAYTPPPLPPLPLSDDHHLHLHNTSIACTACITLIPHTYIPYTHILPPLSRRDSTMATRAFQNSALIGRSGNISPGPVSARLAGASESTPLLAPDDDPDRKVPSSPAFDRAAGQSRALPSRALPSKKKPETPLPRLQILLLCYARLVEPIAFFSIFPYINRMVQENGNVPEANVGFYAGAIESIFSLTQMLVMMFWGRASDRWGRRPVLVLSLAGLAAATSVFGLATRIWQMMLLRCVAGICAGSVVTIRTMIAEHSDASNQARAFSWFAFAGNVGIFVGPLIGGFFLDPAKTFPRLFGGVPFFETHPFVLAPIVVALIGLTAVVTSAVGVDETLHMKDGAEGGGDDVEGARPGPAPKATVSELAKAPGVGIVLVVYGYAMLLGFAYTTLIPTFLYTTPELGGFGFTSIQISIYMALTAGSQAFWILLVLPPLHRRWGSKALLRYCGVVWPFFFAIMPSMNWLLCRDNDPAHTLFWVIFPPMLVVGSSVVMAFTVVQLALNQVCPAKSSLNKLNSMSLSITSGLRAATPAAFNSMFALGVRHNILGGYFVWFVVAALAVGFLFTVSYMPPATDKGGEDDDDERGAEESPRVEVTSN